MDSRLLLVFRSNPLSTHPTWRGAVENLRKLTSSVTPKQRSLAVKAGISLPRNLPAIVAGARLRVAYSGELCVDDVRSASYGQLEYLSTLNEKRARDSRVKSDHIEAGAWIQYYLFKRRLDSLKRLRLESGDIVRVEDLSGIRFEEVVSITNDGRVYFRGGHGAREWPDKISVQFRAKDTSKRARILRQSIANKAAERSTVRAWSLVKEMELQRFKVIEPLTSDDLEQFRNVVDLAKEEKPIQIFLESRPQILAALLGGRSRFVVPHPKLGGKRIPDFLIADVDSRGVNWTLVELETPLSCVTLEDHSILEQHARKGVSQVEEWRQWLLKNLALARQSHREGGLGLVDIRPRSQGLVIVGRRAHLRDNTSDVRFPISEDQRIDVHTYDYLLERLEGALNFAGPAGLNPYVIRPIPEETEDPSVVRNIEDVKRILFDN